MRIDNIFKFGNGIESRLTQSKSCVLFKPNVEMVDETTFVGIEVEVEQVTRGSHVFKLPDGGFLWNNTDDGSLRNNGREFVSIPVKGKEIPFALDKLYSLLAKDPTCVNHEFSKRTGLHVHMNARDMTEEQVLAFLYTYILVEDFFYAYAGQERKNNIFCVPLKEGEKIMSISHLEDRTHPFSGLGQRAGIREVINNWSKYVGLNLIPLTRYGTIEFRHLSGTKDVNSILTWINLILSLKRYALSHSMKDIDNVIDTLNTSSEYIAFLQDVFGEYLQFIPLENPEYKIEQSIIMLKTLKANFQEAFNIYYTKQTQKTLFDGKIDKGNNFFNFFVNKGFMRANQKEGIKKKPTLRTDGTQGQGLGDRELDDAIQRLVLRQQEEVAQRRQQANARPRVVRPAPPPPNAGDRVMIMDDELDF